VTGCYHWTIIVGLDLNVELSVTNLDDDVVGVIMDWASSFIPSSPEPVVTFSGAKAVPKITASLDANFTTSSSGASQVTTTDNTGIDLPKLFCSENGTTAITVSARLLSEPYANVFLDIDTASTSGE